jgi:glycosyltransferase involved in cell wall biosynthesis
MSSVSYKVSLAMPVYNVEKYIERALLSALNQTFDSIEYLLIDDKGTDNSISVAKEIIANHPRGKDVRILDHGINRGTGATKNTAIDNTRGEYLFFMDSDDEITPDCIQFLYDKMIETPVDFVAASIDYITLDGKIEAGRTYRYSHSDSLIKGTRFAVAEAYYLENTGIAVPTWNKLYNLDFLRRNNIRCIPNHLNEDIYFHYQIVLNAGSCRLLPDKTYIYYQIEKSTCSKLETDFTERFARQFTEIYCLSKDHSSSYKGCTFFSELILKNYIASMHCMIRIFNSKNIPINQRQDYIMDISKYPVVFREIKKLNNQILHFSLYLISKMPILDIKILLYRVLLKLMRIKNRLSNNQEK